ncbi:hypothetical protein ACS0PU_010309 [Formica fusca]
MRTRSPTWRRGRRECEQVSPRLLRDRELERKFDEAMSRRWEFARFPMTATTVTWTTVMESAPTTAITANEVNATTLTTTTSTRLGVLRLRGD